MPRRSITVDELIHNLVDYFNQEKQNNGPLIPLTAVHARVSDALKIDTKTISNALRRHQNQDENKENEPQRKSLKTKDMDERQKVKSVLQFTTYTLLTKIKERGIVECKRTSLYHVLLDIGFFFKQTNNRKALCEKTSIASMRIKFLRSYITYKKQDIYKQFVYLDETWIFAKGSNKRIWQDSSSKCFKNLGGEGKRYIVLHAGTEDGFVEGADLIFSTTNKSSDYHDSMNSENFLK
ncbi:hypothetical protein RN001_001815 [Aquatica leii]|uniref:Uncharacterized protein n=1 Tax=Aquatica leii TaxID=1421715 RepID=A0AAN7Q4L3_9COLE|nr:hypothetical protein RN001_001815 [Aquatica leii]